LQELKKRKATASWGLHIVPDASFSHAILGKTFSFQSCLHLTLASAIAAICQCCTLSDINLGPPASCKL